ncbi:MAG: TonB-dependent receptor [Proteobacteria bacterium]|nr:TonB-dependent receptor [Pseudomonadota bacterium]
MKNLLFNLAYSWLVLLFLAGPFSPPARAEENPKSAENLFDVEEEVKTEEWKGEVDKKLKETPLEPETYVVSGSKYAQGMKEAPASMTVLTSEDIQAYGITSLEELLRLVPGVEVKAINPANKLLGERGFFFLTANSVLVLIDGREENTNIFGGVFWGLLPISLGDIERVEIIRGPGSALYGANAYNGVINIVTRHPREEKTARLKEETGFYSGDLGFLKGNAAVAQTYKKLSVKVSGGVDRVMDWADPQEESYRAYRVFGRANYEFSGQTVLDLDGGWVRGDTEAYSWIGEIPLQGMDTSYANLRLQSGSFRFQSNYRRQSTRFSLVSPALANIGEIYKALLKAYDIDLNFNFKTLNQNSESRLEYTRFLGQKNRLTAGITYLFNRFDTDSIVDSPQWEQRGGVYLQDEFRPVESFLVYLGARYDYNSATQDQDIAGSGVRGDLSPRVSLVYLLGPNQSVRASFGRAFRKPSFFESQMHLKTFQKFEQLPPPYDAYSQFLYSPDVQNEHVNNYELGYFTQFWRRYTLTASIFFNQYLDTLNFCDDFRYHNIPYYANSYGGEADLEVLLPRSWRAFVNYGYLGIHQIDVTAQKIAENFPNHHFNLGMRWRPPTGPAFALLFHSVSSYKDAILNPATSSLTGTLDPYENELGNSFLLNVKASYRFWKNRVEIGASVFNLLNDETREYPGGIFPDIENPGQDRNYGGEKPALTAIGFVEVSY